MEAIPQKLQQQIVNNFKPLAEKLAREGKSSEEIVGAFNTLFKIKLRDFYKSDKQPRLLSECLPNAEINKADSKAEKIIYRLLNDYGINFIFQKKIGKYRADFFIDGFLIMEIDGNKHDDIHDKKRDKYLKGEGYTILRIPLMIFINNPEAAIKEICNARYQDRKK